MAVDAKKKAAIDHGEFLLKAFHYEYERKPATPQSEYWRGRFAEWKGNIVSEYGQSEGEDIIFGLSETTGLTIPPAGMLSEDGGIMGMDSFSHMGPIGKLQPSNQKPN